MLSVVTDSPPPGSCNFVNSEWDTLEEIIEEKLTSAWSVTLEQNKNATLLKENPRRNRKGCAEKWKKSSRKKLLNSGQEYITSSGKLKTGKKLLPVCRTTCRLKCYNKLDTETRQKIFNQFWKLGDRAKQWEYINKFSKQNTKKSITNQDFSRQRYRVKYYLPLPKDSDEQISTTQETVQVCLKTFLNTLGTSEQIVRTALNKSKQERKTFSDGRGKHQNHKLPSRRPKYVMPALVHLIPVFSCTVEVKSLKAKT